MAIDDSSAKSELAKKHVAFTTRSSAVNAIPDCSNTPAKICFRRASFRSCRTPTRNSKSLTRRSFALKAALFLIVIRWALAGRLTQIGSVAGRVEVESKEPLRNVYSPTHVIDVKRSSDRRSLVSFESESGKEPQDFQLFYTISKEDFGLTLLTHREAGKHGYFLLMISPKDDWTDQEYSAKDVVFVVDTSGSMAEEGKMEKARAALFTAFEFFVRRIASTSFRSPVKNT